MSKAFRTDFPDEFYFECAMTMDPMDLNFWFETPENINTLGYVDVNNTYATDTPLGNLLFYDGVYYMLMYQIDEIRYIQACYGFSGGRISEDQYQKLIKGEKCG